MVNKILAKKTKAPIEKATTTEQNGEQLKQAPAVYLQSVHADHAQQVELGGKPPTDHPEAPPRTHPAGSQPTTRTPGQAARGKGTPRNQGTTPPQQGELTSTHPQQQSPARTNHPQEQRNRTHEEGENGQGNPSRKAEL